jgi:hypothetical protein
VLPPDKHHPNVAGAFSYILADHLFFQVGLTFGADFSPANWEAVGHVQSALAKQLFSDTSLVAKHRIVLEKIKWCRSQDSRHNVSVVYCDEATIQGTFHER